MAREGQSSVKNLNCIYMIMYIVEMKCLLIIVGVYMTI